jgi:hypothetical protein
MSGVSDDDRALWRDFRDGAVSTDAFDHRLHLRLAYIYLVEHGPESAPAAFKDALLSYLAKHGIDRRKYHETLTRAWLLAVSHFIWRARETSCADDFLARSHALLNPAVILTHYSKDVLFSESARPMFVEPNLDPIPRHSDTIAGRAT